jgi:excisionase family DNA binding protein
MQAIATDAALVTLDEAIRPYKGVSLRMIRGWIACGRLPATRLGRAYLVAPSDVAALLTPKLRAVPDRQRRETPTERAERQLAAAGVGLSG